jgi:hypothetical protein
VNYLGRKWDRLRRSQRRRIKRNVLRSKKRRGFLLVIGRIDWIVFSVTE